MPSDVFLGQIDEALDELVIQRFVDINALDAAAALAGIEESAVDQSLDGMVEIGVGHHIGRVLAAEFQAEPSEGARRGALDDPSAGHRAGEVDEVDLSEAISVSVWSWRGTRLWNKPLRQTRLDEGVSETFADQQRLGRMLEITALPAISAGTMVLIAVR